MHDVSILKQEIIAAFHDVRYPGDNRLVDSLGGGFEPSLVVQEFSGRDDWRVLSADFLDRAPDGFGSALSFFSNAALQFYLPAYLLADLDGLLTLVTPAMRLSGGLDDRSLTETVDGACTWFEYNEQRFSIFTVPQAIAIVHYLKHAQTLVAEAGGYTNRIDEAIRNYWQGRCDPAGR